MITIFICPDCRCEHGEPAEAGYRLEARCFDCTHLDAIATLRGAMSATPQRRAIVRERHAA